MYSKYHLIVALIDSGLNEMAADRIADRCFSGSYGPEVSPREKLERHKQDLFRELNAVQYVLTNKWDHQE